MIKPHERHFRKIVEQEREEKEAEDEERVISEKNESVSRVSSVRKEDPL